MGKLLFQLKSKDKLFQIRVFDNGNNDNLIEIKKFYKRGKQIDFIHFNRLILLPREFVNFKRFLNKFDLDKKE